MKYYLSKEIITHQKLYEKHVDIFIARYIEDKNNFDNYTLLQLILTNQVLSEFQLERLIINTKDIRIFFYMAINQKLSINLIDVFIENVLDKGLQSRHFDIIFRRLEEHQKLNKQQLDRIKKYI